MSTTSVSDSDAGGKFSSANLNKLLPFKIKQSEPAWRMTGNSGWTHPAPEQIGDEEGLCPPCKVSPLQWYLALVTPREEDPVCSDTEKAKRVAQETKGIEEFARILSHRLRAPVANALGLATLLEDGMTTAGDQLKCHKLLGAVIREIDREIKELNSVLARHREWITQQGA